MTEKSCVVHTSLPHPDLQLQNEQTEMQKINENVEHQVSCDDDEMNYDT